MRTEYRDGDRVEDGQGNVGYVRSCKRDRGGTYLRVLVTAGPRVGQWFWPEDFAVPALDWSEHGPLTVCAECDRSFHGGHDADGMRQILCRTCAADAARVDRAMEADPSHGAGSRLRRLRE